MSSDSPAKQNRLERHLMRSRGAGARTIESDFGFSFAFSTLASSSQPVSHKPSLLGDEEPPTKRRKTIAGQVDTSPEKFEEVVIVIAEAPVADSSVDAEARAEEVEKTDAIAVDEKTKRVRRRFQPDGDAIVRQSKGHGDDDFAKRMKMTKGRVGPGRKRVEAELVLVDDVEPEDAATAPVTVKAKGMKKRMERVDIAQEDLEALMDVGLDDVMPIKQATAKPKKTKRKAAAEANIDIETAGTVQADEAPLEITRKPKTVRKKAAFKPVSEVEEPTQDAPTTRRLKRKAAADAGAQVTEGFMEEAEPIDKKRRGVAALPPAETAAGKPRKLDKLVEHADEILMALEPEPELEPLEVPHSPSPAVEKPKRGMKRPAKERAAPKARKSRAKAAAIIEEASIIEIPAELSVESAAEASSLEGFKPYAAIPEELKRVVNGPTKKRVAPKARKSRAKAVTEPAELSEMEVVRLQSPPLAHGNRGDEDDSLLSITLTREKKNKSCVDRHPLLESDANRAMQSLSPDKQDKTCSPSPRKPVKKATAARKKRSTDQGADVAMRIGRKRKLHVGRDTMQDDSPVSDVSMMADHQFEENAVMEKGRVASTRKTKNAKPTDKENMEPCEMESVRRAVARFSKKREQTAQDAIRKVDSTNDGGPRSNPAKVRKTAKPRVPHKRDVLESSQRAVAEPPAKRKHAEFETEPEFERPQSRKADEALPSPKPKRTARQLKPAERAPSPTPSAHIAEPDIPAARPSPLASPKRIKKTAKSIGPTKAETLDVEEDVDWLFAPMESAPKPLAKETPTRRQVNLSKIKMPHIDLDDLVSNIGCLVGRGMEKVRGRGRERGKGIGGSSGRRNHLG